MITPTILNNRYRVIRVLGSGGFGETFLAEDTQMPSGRRCVIKQLKPVVNNPQVYQLVKERFQREAAILEELGDGSNQIPRLYAYFVENDQFFLVQEYIDGQTLTEKLQQHGLLSESSVREILINILPTLDYVHSKRIVHRDIKPENILIRNSDGKPVLIDFGAVKETMGTVVTASGNSSRSIVIGTPGFMPIEQTAGRPVFASDLYSLGLTAIYLLTGKIPQQLQSDPATGDILWRNYALSVSHSFATILDRAIASHARDRYSSAKEMLQALQIGGTPIAPIIQPSNPTVVAVPPPAPYAQTPKVVSATPAGFSSQQPVYSGSSSQVRHGMNDWQKAVIIGGVIGACVVGGLWLTRGQPPVEQPPLPSPTVVPPTPSPTPSEPTPPNPDSQQVQPTFPPQPSPVIPDNTNTPSTDTSPQPKLTLTDAKDLINNWLHAKKLMFGPNYDSQPASELTVDDQLTDAYSTINSLKNDEQHYEFGLQQIDRVDDFSVNGNEAIIQVKVTEKRTLFDKNRNIIPKETDVKTRTVNYTLKFVDGRWKISKTNSIS